MGKLQSYKKAEGAKKGDLQYLTKNKLLHVHGQLFKKTAAKSSTKTTCPFLLYEYLEKPNTNQYYAQDGERAVNITRPANISSLRGFDSITSSVFGWNCKSDQLLLGSDHNMLFDYEPFAPINLYSDIYRPILFASSSTVDVDDMLKLSSEEDMLKEFLMYDLFWFMPHVFLFFFVYN